MTEEEATIAKDAINAEYRRVLRRSLNANSSIWDAEGVEIPEDPNTD